MTGYSKNIVTEEKNSAFSALINGVMIAYAITCLVFITYAMLITYSSFTGENVSTVVTVTGIISVIVAGYDAAKGAGSHGWAWGMTAGLMYAVILAIIGLMLNKGFVFDGRTFMLFLISIAGGGLGGVVGVNLKR